MGVLAPYLGVTELESLPEKGPLMKSDFHYPLGNNLIISRRESFGDKTSLVDLSPQGGIINNRMINPPVWCCIVRVIDRLTLGYNRVSIETLFV